MSDEELRHDEIEFEREDLSPAGILGFLAGLAITGVLMCVILFGMYRYLDRYERTHQPSQNPLVNTANVNPSKATAEDANKFPLPRLETNERSEIYNQRRTEEDTLNTYGWVDQKAGIARIPIDRAMQIIAQRGLPTAPPSNAAQAQKPKASNAGKPAGKAPAKP